MGFRFIDRVMFVLFLVSFFISGLYAQRDVLTLSDGSLFVGKEFYPEFSWETTPMYYMFGDTKRVLLNEEVAFIAERTDFLCIEKSHGFNEFGAAELGAGHEVAAFKSIKPTVKVLFYFNSAYAWPFTSYNKYFRHKEINKHPELKKLLIKDPQTGEPLQRKGAYLFDVLNPETREWWVNTVVKGVKESGSDGAFIDQMHGFYFLRPEKSDEIRIAMGKMMIDLKKELGPDKILLGNNAAQELAQYAYPACDAVMFEHYNPETISKEKLLEDWQHMQRIAKDGKMSIFRIGVEVEKHLLPNEKSHKNDYAEEMAQFSKERLEYYLACFLIGAQPYSYFQYGWGWRLDTGSLIDYPALQKPLGAPKGAYTRVSQEKWIFTREFEHASVWVDTDKGIGKIIWK